jgi:hypothetical protein
MKSIVAGIVTKTNAILFTSFQSSGFTDDLLKILTFPTLAFLLPAVGVLRVVVTVGVLAGDFFPDPLLSRADDGVAEVAAADEVDGGHGPSFFLSKMASKPSLGVAGCETQGHVKACPQSETADHKKGDHNGDSLWCDQ